MYCGNDFECQDPPDDKPDHSIRLAKTRSQLFHLAPLMVGVLLASGCALGPQSADAEYIAGSANLPSPAGPTAEIHAHVAIRVDENGVVDDWIELDPREASTFPSLADIVHSCRFRPAREEGRDVPTLLGLVFTRGSGPVGLEIQPIEAFGQERGRPSLLAHLDDLDTRPRLVRNVQPVVAPGDPSARTSGRVLAEYIIDPQGEVRLPIVIEGTSEALGSSVLEAVRQWRFTPPRRGGLAVFVLVRQEFEFVP